MKKVYILIFIFLFIITGVFLLWSYEIKAVNPNDKSKKIFVINKGQSVKEIAYSLKKEGLIKNPIIFSLLIKKLNFEQKIQAGDFRLSASMTAEEIANSLTTGTIDLWITIPEGKRAEEIGEILKETIITYKEDWDDELRIHEGYLFPDTYLLPKDASIKTIISIFKNNFENKYQKIESNNINYSKNQIVVIASLIEREAKFNKDRPLISSVIHNRLEIEMPLQIDATIQYALGFSKKEQNWWRKEITFNDLKISSLYNTYKNPGLPPFPIANPGSESLKAALNPSETNYLYYLSDNFGNNHYAKTLAEHNQNIKKYGL